MPIHAYNCLYSIHVYELCCLYMSVHVYTSKKNSALHWTKAFLENSNASPSRPRTWNVKLDESMSRKCVNVIQFLSDSDMAAVIATIFSSRLDLVRKCIKMSQMHSLSLVIVVYCQPAKGLLSSSLSFTNQLICEDFRQGRLLWLLPWNMFASQDEARHRTGASWHLVWALRNLSIQQTSAV